MKNITVLLNDSLQEGATSQTALIVPKGIFQHPFGRQIVDEAAMGRILSVIIANGLDIEVDYNHSAIKGAVSAEDGKAAGWIKPDSMRVTPEGLTGIIEWNETAANMIRKREYRYLSPVFKGEQKSAGDFFITRLVNVALCNVPNIPQNPLINEINSNTKEKPKMELKKLAQALGLPESATEAECDTAIAAMRAGVTAANSIYSTLAVNDAAGAMTKVLELQKPPAHSPGDIAAMQSRLAALEKTEGDTLIANAISEGRLTPAQKDWAASYYAQSPEGFRLYLNSAAVIVPLGSAASGASRVTDTGGVMTDTDRAACVALGVSEDKFKAANGLK